MHKTVLENPALQVRVKLVHDELWQAAVRVRLLLKARPILADERVQKRVFRAARCVAFGVQPRRARSRRAMGHGSPLRSAAAWA